MGVRNLLFVALFFFSSLTTISQSLDDVSKLYSEGNYDQAKEMLKGMDQTGEVLYWQGFLNYSTRHLNQAMVYYFEAIPKLEGDWRHRAIVGVSEIIRKNNLPNEALKNIRIAIEEQEKDYDLYSMYYNLGVINRDLGNLNEAIANIAVAITHTNNSIKKSKCNNMIGYILQLDGEYVASNNYFDKADSGPYYGKAQHNKAWNHIYLGDTVKGIQALKEVLKIREGKERFLTLKDIGTLTGDLDMLDAAIELLPNNPDPDEYKVFYEAHNLKNDPKYFDSYVAENERYIERSLEAERLYKKYAALNTLAMIERTQQLREEQAANRWILPAAITSTFLLFAFIAWKLKRKGNVVMLVNDKMKNIENKRA